MKISRSSRRGAFTLLEIMLVVSIIALLLGAAMYNLGDVFGIATDARVKADLTSLNTNLGTYSMINGFYPTTEQGLQALVSAPQSDPKPARWHQFTTKIPKDPWNSEYVYLQPGVHNPNTYDLYSKGKDHKEGTADDLGNWGDWAN